MNYLKNCIGKVAVLLCLIIFCFSVSLTVCSVPDAIAAGDSAKKKVVGYLPDWSYEAYKNIDFSALTHINISFCNFNSNGEMICGIPDEGMYDLVKKAHDNEVKIMAALGGGGYGEPYRDMISSADKVQSLNAKIIEFCEKYGLDGVDLDIEISSSDSIWENYGVWVSELRAICDARGWLLSTATAQWVAESVKQETFALFDYLNIMSYDNDMSGTNSHSSYEFSVECLNYFHNIKKVPKEKLVLGVPFYGRGYDSHGNLDWNSYMSFSEIVKADATNYNKDYFGNIAYTGADTMRKKCELSKEYGGIMVWEITLDAEGEYSLLSVIKEEILSHESDAEIDNGNKLDTDMIFWIVIGAVSGAIITVAVILVIIIIMKIRKWNANKFI